jgi:hypothetical protein
MLQIEKSKEELVKELRELVEDSSLTVATWTMDSEEEKKSTIEQYRQESIQRPYYVDDDPKYFKGTKEHRKMVRRWRKWIKAKRKKYVKYFKEWCPFDSAYLYNPIKMILEDMFEYYKRGDNVCGIPVIMNDDGKIIQQDNRKQTLATALMMLEEAELAEDQYLPEANDKLKEAFAYIAEYMGSWWD